MINITKSLALLIVIIFCTSCTPKKKNETISKHEISLQSKFKNNFFIGAAINDRPKNASPWPKSNSTHILRPSRSMRASNRASTIRQPPSCYSANRCSTQQAQRQFWPMKWSAPATPQWMPHVSLW